MNDKFDNPKYTTISMSDEINGVKVNAQEHVDRVSETSNVEILDLPSNYIFYTTDAINVRRFKWREYSLLAQSQESNSFQSLAESISRTILDYNGMKITYGDFRYIMYIHRLQMARPFNVEWTCTNTEHMAWVQLGKPKLDAKGNPEMDADEQPIMVPMDAKTLENNNRLTRSKLTLIRPQAEELRRLVGPDGCLVAAPGLKVYTPSLQDAIESGDDLENLIDRGADKEWSYAQLQREQAAMKRDNLYAGLLHPESHGVTLAERRKSLEAWMDAYEGDHYLVLEALDQYNVAQDHGVVEEVEVKCEACGAKQRVPIRFSPTQFFPDVAARSDT